MALGVTVGAVFNGCQPILASFLLQHSIGE